MSSHENVSYSKNPSVDGRGRPASIATIPLTRRDLLVLGSSLAAAPWLGAKAQDAATSAPALDEFMAMSRVLTGFDDLQGQDEAIGREYLEALTSRPEGARRLAELWQRGGFGRPQPPASVADLTARGIYERSELAELADTITGNWYSGTYIGPNGERRVATYTRALAWRTLGYRPAGPSACGGGFGHWAERPAEV